MNHNEGSIPRLFGLTKVCKPQVPLQPTAMSTSSKYQLAKYLLRLRHQSLREDNNSTKSSATFLTDIELNTEERMVSFDLKSFFTDILIEVA